MAKSERQGWGVAAKLTITVDFLLLKLNTPHHIIHKEQRLIGSWFWRVGRSRAWHRYLVRAFLLGCHMLRHSEHVAPLTRPPVPRWDPP